MWNDATGIGAAVLGRGRVHFRDQRQIQGRAKESRGESQVRQ